MKKIIVAYSSKKYGVIDKMENYIVCLLVFLFKPIIKFIYGKQNRFKKLTFENKKQILKTFFCKVVTVCTLIVMGVVIALSASVFEQKVNAQNDEILHKYYTSVTIEPGDTLWSIADTNYADGYDNHSDYIKEVMHINHLESSEQIISGTSLVIPYYSYEIK